MSVHEILYILIPVLFLLSLFFLLRVQAVRPVLVSLTWLLWIAVSILNISLQWLLVMWTSMRIILTMLFFACLRVVVSLESTIVFGLNAFVRKDKFSSEVGKHGHTQRLLRLRNHLFNVTDFTEWCTIASEIDKLSEMDAWAVKPVNKYFDYELLLANIDNIKKAQDSDNIRDLMFVLPGSLQRSFCGISHERLFSRRLLGTKLIIEEFILELERSIQIIRNSEQLTTMEKIAFFESASLSIGHTALCLSGGGSLSMYHMGVVKVLLEQKLLPKYISGTSGGSIVCCIVGMYTDEELLNDIIKNDISNRYGLSWFEPMTTQILHFATRGVLMDNQFFGRTCAAYFKDMTFEEAYNRTGRVITITLTKSMRGTRKLDADVVLLNHVTSPHVLLRSAVEASCALPGLMNPVELLAKDRHGVIKKYYPDGARFVDGSLTADVPMKRLSQLFNTSHFIVSQVNPHIVPFASRIGGKCCTGKDGVLPRLLRLAVNDLQSSARKLAKLRLIPNLFGHDVSTVLTQKYRGDITIYPRIGLIDTFNVLSHPSEADMARYIREGERSIWPHIPRMRQVLKVEYCIRSVLDDLRQFSSEMSRKKSDFAVDGLCRNCSFNHMQANPA